MKIENLITQTIDNEIILEFSSLVYHSSHFIDIFGKDFILNRFDASHAFTNAILEMRCIYQSLPWLIG